MKRFGLGALVLVSACGGGDGGSPDASGSPDTAVNPDAGPPQHLYVSTATDVLVYDLPLTANSTPTVTLPVDGNNATCTDGHGTVFVVVTAAGAFQVEAFATPLTASSTPLYALATTYASRDCKVDADGNLFVVANQSDTEGIDVFPGPVSAASTVSTNLSATGMSGPYGLAMDADGDLFASAATAVVEFGPFASGNQALASFGTIPNNNNYGLQIGPDGSLYVDDLQTVDVYLPSQFHDGTTAPDHTISLANNGYYDAFDAGGNLYVAALDAQGNGFLYVFAPPYTAAAAVTASLPGFASLMIGN